MRVHEARPRAAACRPHAGLPLGVEQQAEAPLVAGAGVEVGGRRRVRGRDRGREVELADLVGEGRRDGRGVEDPGAVERPAGEDHALELQVVARRRVQPVAAGPPLRLLRPVDARDGAHAPSSPRRWTGTELRALLLAHQERRRGHPQRPEDVLGEVVVERLAARRLDHEAEPVGVDAVLVLRARVGDERRGEDRVGAREHVRRAGRPPPSARCRRSRTSRRARWCGSRAGARSRGVAGGRSRGVSPSKPSSTWRSANSGRYCSTGASRSRLPRSTCCRAAVVVTIFVIDAIRNIVSGRHGLARADLARAGRPLVDRAARVGRHRHDVGHVTRVDCCLQHRVDPGAHGPPPPPRDGALESPPRPRDGQPRATTTANAARPIASEAAIAGA